MGCTLAKHEWGTKHTCGTCEATFYDLMKSAPVCPSCGTKIKMARSTPVNVPKPAETKSKSMEAKSSTLDVENDDDPSIDEAPDDKELLEEVEDDVEGDVKEVIETNVSGEGPD